MDNSVIQVYVGSLHSQLTGYTGGCEQSESKEHQKTSMYMTAWYLKGSKWL